MPKTYKTKTFVHDGVRYRFIGFESGDKITACNLQNGKFYNFSKEEINGDKSELKGVI